MKNSLYHIRFNMSMFSGCSRVDTGFWTFGEVGSSKEINIFTSEWLTPKEGDVLRTESMGWHNDKSSADIQHWLEGMVNPGLYNIYYIKTYRVNDKYDNRGELSRVEITYILDVKGKGNDLRYNVVNYDDALDKNGNIDPDKLFIEPDLSARTYDTNQFVMGDKKVIETFYTINP